MTGGMTNPLLIESSLPYNLPDFARIETDHYREALLAGIAEHRDEIDAIANNPEAPTFDNTVAALERAGRTLHRAAMVFFNKLSSDSDDQLRDLDAEFAPILSAHHDALWLNGTMHDRVEAVHAAIREDSLDDESRYLVGRYLVRFQLAGAGLGDDQKAELSAMNQRLAELTTRFGINLFHETTDLAVVFDHAEELDGLSAGELSACAEAAAHRQLAGKYVVSLVLYSVHPFLARLTNRESRRRVYAATAQRANRGNDRDNNPVVREITALRAKRAGLLGFDSHAAASVADQTAGSTAAIEEVIYPLAGPALVNLEREATDLQQVIDETQAASGQPSFELAPWDWPFYAEQIRRSRFDIDSAALRPYFECDRVLFDGVFHAATMLYGVTFSERTDLQGYHPWVRIFEVFETDGTAIGLFLHDVYTRDAKRGGAWMNNLVDQSHLFAERPVICNNLNVPRPEPGAPTLLTLDEVRTMFHEFGHALHGLFSDAHWPMLSGTAVSRDFVEFPSQVNEMWITWPEVIENYARHIDSEEAIDPAIVDRIRASESFNEGFATTEYLAAALLDQEWHKIPPGSEVDDPQAFEATALERTGLSNPWVAPRYRTTYFQHTFAGGYDAGYYSYIWSEVLDADTVQWFKEHDGLTRDNGDRFRRELLSRGHTKDPLESFREFRGRDAELAPLLERRGLVS